MALTTQAIGSGAGSVLATASGFADGYAIGKCKERLGRLERYLEGSDGNPGLKERIDDTQNPQEKRGLELIQDSTQLMSKNLEQTRQMRRVNRIKNAALAIGTGALFLSSVVAATVVIATPIGWGLAGAALVGGIGLGIYANFKARRRGDHIGALKQQNAQAQAQLTSLKSEQQELKQLKGLKQIKTFGDLSTQKSQLTVQQSLKQEQLLAQQAIVQDATEKIESLSSQIKSLESEIEHRQTEIDSLSAQVEHDQITRPGLEDTEQELLTRESDLTQDLGTLTGTRTQINQQLQLHTRFKELDRLLDDALPGSQQAIAIANEIRTLGTQLRGIASEESLREQLTALDLQIQTKNQDLGTCRTELSTTQASLNRMTQRSTKLSKLKSEQSQARIKLQSLKSTQTQQQTRLDEARQQIGDEHSGLSKEIHDIGTELASVQQKRDAIRPDLQPEPPGDVVIPEDIDAQIQTQVDKINDLGFDAPPGELDALGTQIERPR